MPDNKNPLGLFGTLLAAAGGAVGGWMTYSALFVRHDVPIGNAIDAERHAFETPVSGKLAYYADTSGTGRPVVLIHSINAAGSSYEMHPIFNQYRGQRPIYALDLPGFGFSERSDRVYSPQLYAHAILDFLKYLDLGAVDVVTLSLGGEFVARAAVHTPDLFNSITMISPSGLSQRENRNRSQSASDTPAADRAYNIVSSPLVGQPLYDLLVTKPSIRWFLGQSFCGDPDEGLLAYDWLTAHQPGARYAPLYFVSGKLFTSTVYEEFFVKLEMQVLVLYDKDNFVNFDRLPHILDQRSNWRARRIPNTCGLPHFERMDKVADALDEFWAEVS